MVLFVCAISCCFLNACVPSLHSLLDTQHLPRKSIRQCWTTGSKLCKYPSTDTGGPLSSFLYVAQLVLFIRCIVTCLSAQQAAFPSPWLVSFSPDPTRPWPFSHISVCSQKSWNTLPAIFASGIEGVEEEGFWTRTSFAMARKFPRSARWCVSPLLGISLHARRQK